MLCFMGLFSFLGCRKNNIPGIEGRDGLGKKAKENTSGIVSFSYHYNGSIGGDSYSISLKKKDGVVKASYESMEYSDFGEIEKEVSEQYLTDLYELYRKHKVCQWDGFDKYATDVLDGDGFSLSYGFADKTSMRCSGSNAYPDGYHAFETDMRTVSEPLLEELKEAGRQKLIEEGVSGEMTSALIDFKQKGTSGSDSYEIFIITPTSHRTNFEVRVNSESGEIWPKGEHIYMWSIEDKTDLALDKIAKTAEKYGLVNWIYYEKAAEDYNNAEWFQIALSYEQGQIRAMGTDHPENYASFRKEVLQMMKEHIDQLMKKDPSLTEQ